MHKVLVRTISGVIYIALIVGCILGGPMWFISLMAVFAIAAVVELHRVAGVKYKNWAAVTSLELDCLMAVATVYMSCLSVLPSWIEVCIIGILLLYLPVRLTLALYDKDKDSFRDTALSVFSMAYIAIPLLLLSLVYSDSYDNRMLVLASFIMIWLNDTGAFCVGSLFGRHRLFERLSPKKSWEGFFGGLVLSILSGLLFYTLMPEIGYTRVMWMSLGALVSVFVDLGRFVRVYVQAQFQCKKTRDILYRVMAAYSTASILFSLLRSVCLSSI